jgi:hypothetical protein
MITHMLVGHRLDVSLDLSLEKFDPWFREWVDLKRMLEVLAFFGARSPNIPADIRDN